MNLHIVKPGQRNRPPVPPPGIRVVLGVVALPASPDLRRALQTSRTGPLQLEVNNPGTSHAMGNVRC